MVSGIDIKFIFSADHTPGPISSSAGAGVWRKVVRSGETERGNTFICDY